MAYRDPIDINLDFSRLEMPTSPIGGVNQPLYVLGQEISRGANAIVLLCENRLLKRQEAMKIWTRLRKDDTRDKLHQGMLEVSAAASAVGDAVVPIYHAGVLPAGLFYCTMQFVKGWTLKEVLSHKPSRALRIAMANDYLDALHEAERSGVVHGDAHVRNVMLEAGSRKPRLRLLDFGTSKFNKPGRSLKRHYAIIESTLHKIFQQEELSFRPSRKIRRRDCVIVNTKDADRETRYAAYREHVYAMDYLSSEEEIKIDLLKPDDALQHYLKSLWVPRLS